MFHTNPQEANVEKLAISSSITAKELMRGYDNYIPMPEYKKIYTGKKRALISSGGRLKIKAGRQGRTKTIRTNKLKNRHVGTADFPGTVLNRTIIYIVWKVLSGEFNFKLDDKADTIEIKLRKLKKPVKYFRQHKIDPLMSNFEAYEVVLYDGTTDVYYSIKLTNVFEKMLRKRHRERTISKISTTTVFLRDIVKVINENFTESVTNGRINRLLRIGFGRIIRGLRKNCRFVFFRRLQSNGEEMYAKTYIEPKKKAGLTPKFRLKDRYLHYVHQRAYSGYYYTALTDEEFNLFHTRYYTKKLFLCEKECMRQSHEKFPHIVRVRVAKPLFKKYLIYRSITYEEDRTEYIWRWNGSGFESVDNSQFRFNLLFKRDDNNI